MDNILGLMRNVATAATPLVLTFLVAGQRTSMLLLAELCRWVLQGASIRAEQLRLNPM